MTIESVMPSNHLILCHPLLPSVFPTIRVFSNELARSLHQVAKVLAFRLRISAIQVGSGVRVKKWKLLSCVQLFGTPRTIQSMGFSRPEYWSGYLFPSPGDLPSPGIKPRSPALQIDSLPAEPPGKSKNTGVGRLSLLGVFWPRNWTGVSPHCG